MSYVGADAGGSSEVRHVPHSSRIAWATERDTVSK